MIKIIPVSYILIWCLFWPTFPQAQGTGAGQHPERSFTIELDGIAFEAPSYVAFAGKGLPLNPFNPLTPSDYWNNVKSLRSRNLDFAISIGILSPEEQDLAYDRRDHEKACRLHKGYRMVARGRIAFSETYSTLYTPLQVSGARKQFTVCVQIQYGGVTERRFALASIDPIRLQKFRKMALGRRSTTALKLKECPWGPGPTV